MSDGRVKVSISPRKFDIPKLQCVPVSRTSNLLLAEYQYIVIVTPIVEFGEQRCHFPLFFYLASDQRKICMLLFTCTSGGLPHAFTFIPARRLV
jgi:hypothetical protein